jgi:hypothetical protein
MLWTPRQRIVLIVFILGVSTYLLIRLSLNRAYISDPPPVRGALADELVDRINPNVATWQELAALPAIGEAKAKEIVAWRDDLVAKNPGRTPFRSEDDLLLIKGMGVSTLETLRPHLAFPRAYNGPATTATTRTTERP